MELKLRALSETNVSSAARQRWLRRLVKAMAHGNALRELSASAGCVSINESEAYAAWLKGLALESKGDYGYAKETFNSARLTYESLAGKETNSSIFLERAADCTTAAQRCAFANCEQRSAIEATQPETSEAEVSTTGTLQTDSTRVRWCGLDVYLPRVLQGRLSLCKLDKEPTVANILETCSSGGRGLCLKSRDSVASLDSTLPCEGHYEKRLQELEDLTLQLRMEDGSNFIGGIDRNTHLFELIISRVTYEKLKLLYERCDAIVAERASSWRFRVLDTISIANCRVREQDLVPDDILHLIENLMQVSSDMVGLADVGDAKDEALTEALNARAVVLLAYNSHFLAETYAICASEASKTLRLLLESARIADRALREVEACEAVQISREMAHLQDASSAAASRIKGICFLQSQGSNPTGLSGQQMISFTLLDNIEVHAALTNAANLCMPPTLFLISFPLKMRLVPCPPILFNLAHNHLGLPSFEPKLSLKSGRRLFGWFHR